MCPYWHCRIASAAYCLDMNTGWGMLCVTVCSETEQLSGADEEHTWRKLCRSNNDDYSNRVGLQCWTVHQPTTGSSLTYDIRYLYSVDIFVLVISVSSSNISSVAWQCSVWSNRDCSPDNGCVHNQKSNQSDLLKIIHNQIQICSDASEKNLTSWWEPQDFCKPRPWRMWSKCSDSQFQVANHRDWGIMGYNDVIVCIAVIKSHEGVLFHWTGSISSDNSDRSDCWLWIQPLKNDLRDSKLCYLVLVLKNYTSQGSVATHLMCGGIFCDHFLQLS